MAKKTVSEVIESVVSVVSELIGAAVLYRYRAEDGVAGHAIGEVRPATVVRVSKDQHGEGVDGHGLLVMTDGKLDFPHGVPGGGHHLHVANATIGTEPGTFSLKE